MKFEEGFHVADPSPEQRAAVRDDRAVETPAAYIYGILDRELKLTLAGVELGSERDRSMRELTRTAATLYEGRIHRELIQNAYDGSGDEKGAIILLRFDRSIGGSGVVDVANSGTGFGRDNVDAIVNPALSNKRPGNSIGHKGLGFRSVGLISDDPQIYSIRGRYREGLNQFDGFCFRFADPAAQLRHLREISDSPHVEEAAGRTHQLQLPLPIDRADPGVSEYVREGFATLVRLPLRDEAAAKLMASEIEELFEERAPLALFLNRLARLTIEVIQPDGSRSARVISRSPKRHSDLDGVGQLSVDVVTTDSRRFLVARRQVERERFMEAVEEAIRAKFPVEKWLEWEGAPTVSIAFGLDADAQPGTYYAFLPMREEAPFHGFVDAPFFPDPDRKGLSLANPLNDMLLDVAAEMCVSLSSAIAGTNSSASDLTHAAVDAIAWRIERSRMLRAISAEGVNSNALLLPAMRRAGTDDRWAPLADVFDWIDEEHRSLKSAWIAKVAGLPVLRRNLGARRVENLHALAAGMYSTLVPSDRRIAGWIPLLAADLNRRRRFSRQDWEDFYADLSELKDVLPWLKGEVIFRAGEGRLVSANSEDESASRFFISVEHKGSRRRRRRLADADVYPPASVTQNMAFADSAISWSEGAAQAFFDAGLASEFSLVEVLGCLGSLLGERPTQKRQQSALAWAFSAWKDNRTPEIERALASSGLAVPNADGTLVPAGSARFSRGWRGTAGDRLLQYCEELGPKSRMVRTLAGQLLPAWEDWPHAARGSASDWVEFLTHLGVVDGLQPVTAKDEVESPWFWQRFRTGEAQPQTFEATTGQLWRTAVRPYTEHFRYSTKLYSTAGSLWVLPGQAFYDDFSPPAKLAFAQLVLAMLRRPRSEWFKTVLRKTEGNWDTVTWPSPMAAFLRLARWVPLAGADEFEGAAPSDCWFAPRTELPRFVRRMDRSVREAIESSPTLQKTLSETLGMPLWADPENAGRRVAALGGMLGDRFPESEHDSFRKAYREAWLQWAEADEVKALPSRISLAVDRGGRLSRLDAAKDDTAREVIYLADGNSQMLEHLLSALGAPVLHVPATAADKAEAALETAIGGPLSQIRHEMLQVIVDGEEFQPSGDLPPLVGDGLEWLAELSVLVLELNTPLTSRNTARARLQLHDSIKKVRMRFADHVAVSIGRASGPLPDELQGVLPIVGEEFGVLVAEARPDDMGWPLLVRLAGPLATAVGRPDLADSFRLAFLALERSSLETGGALERPSDDAVARALGRPVTRVRELYRSLRSNVERLLEYLVPVVHALAGTDHAERLLERADQPLDDTDIEAMLQGSGFASDRTREIIEVCRDAESMNGVRRALGIDLATMNASLVALGGRWRPISFADSLNRAFRDRVLERRVDLENAIRDARMADFDTGASLASYVAETKLEWLAMPADWPQLYDEVDETLLDGAMDHQLRLRFGTLAPSGEAPVEEVRQSNRLVLTSSLDRVRRIVRAWTSRPGRARASDWDLPSDQIVRKVVASGALDFRPVDQAGAPLILKRAGLWPKGMTETLDLARLGMGENDLKLEEQEEKKRAEQLLKERRSIRFGSVDIDGGSARPFDDVAAVLGGALRGEAFKKRSGLADLEPVTAQASKRKRSRGGGGGTADPEYMSEEQRKLLGFAGELAAFHYLKRTQRNFSEDYWVSSMGRIYLGRSPGPDTEGFDFHIPRHRGDIFYEVKAHTGDPGYVDLERSQIMAAAAIAAARGGARWSILYVTHVRDPDLIAVHELPNPYDRDGAKYFREKQKGGVRLVIQRR